MLADQIAGPRELTHRRRTRAPRPSSAEHHGAKPPPAKDQPRIYDPSGRRPCRRRENPRPVVVNAVVLHQRARAWVGVKTMQKREQWHLRVRQHSVEGAPQRARVRISVLSDARSPYTRACVWNRPFCAVMTATGRPMTAATAN
eukprot:7385117-Prymnesium_polylepis.2